MSNILKSWITFYYISFVEKILLFFQFEKFVLYFTLKFDCFSTHVLMEIPCMKHTIFISPIGWTILQCWSVKYNGYTKHKLIQQKYLWIFSFVIKFKFIRFLLFSNINIYMQRNNLDLFLNFLWNTHTHTNTHTNTNFSWGEKPFSFFT